MAYFMLNGKHYYIRNFLNSFNADGKKIMTVQLYDNSELQIPAKDILVNVL